MSEYPIVNGMMGHLPRNKNADFGPYNIESCSICRELDSEKNIISSTQNFVSFPDIGQIVEGYVQVVAKKHRTRSLNFFSTGHLPTEWLQELEHFTRGMKERVVKEYGQAIVFEHGEISPVKKDRRVATVHMHLHIVPTQESILGQITDNGLFGIDRISSLQELAEPISNNKPYYFYEDIDGQRYLLCFEGELPSQVLRKYISNINWIRESNQVWLKRNGSEIDPSDCWECMLFRPADRFYSTIKKLRGEKND